MEKAAILVEDNFHPDPTRPQALPRLTGRAGSGGGRGVLSCAKIALPLTWAMPEDAKQLADDAIVRLVLGGQTDAFRTLVERYEGYVFRLANQHVPAQDVEDVAQDAFLRAFKALPGFQGQGGGFGPWLATITVRSCHDYWRRVYRSRETPISHLTEDHARWLDSALAESSREKLAEQGAAEQARELLRAGLDRLSADDRLVLQLVYLEGHSGTEAASLLNWSTAKVKVRCFRARRKLEKYLLKLTKSEGI